MDVKCQARAGRRCALRRCCVAANARRGRCFARGRGRLPASARAGADARFRRAGLLQHHDRFQPQPDCGAVQRLLGGAVPADRGARAADGGCAPAPRAAAPPAETLDGGGKRAARRAAPRHAAFLAPAARRRVAPPGSARSPRAGATRCAGVASHGWNPKPQACLRCRCHAADPHASPTQGARSAGRTTERCARSLWDNAAGAPPLPRSRPAALIRARWGAALRSPAQPRPLTLLPAAPPACRAACGVAPAHNEAVLAEDGAPPRRGRASRAPHRAALAVKSTT